MVEVREVCNQFKWWALRDINSWLCEPTITNTHYFSILMSTNHHITIYPFVLKIQDMITSIITFVLKNQDMITSFKILDIN